MKILGEQLKCFQNLQEINTRTASVERSLEGKSTLLLAANVRNIAEYNEVCLWVEFKPRLSLKQKHGFR